MATQTTLCAPVCFPINFQAFEVLYNLTLTAGISISIGISIGIGSYLDIQHLLIQSVGPLTKSMCCLNIERTFNCSS